MRSKWEFELSKENFIQFLSRERSPLTHASALLPDARGGGLLRVCAPDAGVPPEGALQTQHGRAWTLHLPVWVSAAGEASLKPQPSPSNLQWKHCPHGGGTSFFFSFFFLLAPLTYVQLKSILFHRRSNCQSWTSILDLRVSTRPCTPRHGSSPSSSPSSLCL